MVRILKQGILVFSIFFAVGNPAFALEDGQGCMVDFEMIGFSHVQALGAPGADWPMTRDGHFRVVNIKASGPMCDLLAKNPNMVVGNIDERFPGVVFAVGERFEGNVVHGVPVWMNLFEEYRNTLSIAPSDGGPWKIEHGLLLKGLQE